MNSKVGYIIMKYTDALVLYTYFLLFSESGGGLDDVNKKSAAVWNSSTME